MAKLHVSTNEEFCFSLDIKLGSDKKQQAIQKELAELNRKMMLSAFLGAQRMANISGKAVTYSEGYEGESNDFAYYEQVFYPYRGAMKRVKSARAVKKAYLKWSADNKA